MQKKLSVFHHQIDCKNRGFESLNNRVLLGQYRVQPMEPWDCSPTKNERVHMLAQSVKVLEEGFYAITMSKHIS